MDDSNLTVPKSAGLIRALQYVLSAPQATPQPPRETSTSNSKKIIWGVCGVIVIAVMVIQLFPELIKNNCNKEITEPPPIKNEQENLS